MKTALPTADQLRHEWSSNPRWNGITRPYTAEDVVRLRGSVHVEHSLARLGAEKLWASLHSEPFVNALGALTGNQAMQQVKAGLKAIYLSGWQVAADANIAGEMYPDQSLYPANAAPELCRRINRTLQRADQIEHAEGGAKRDWFAPIVADAEAGFGGPLNSFEIMKAFIEAGASGVHFEDQLASEKKCGHLGGKVLIPTQAHERNLIAARLAAELGHGRPLPVSTRREQQHLVALHVGHRGDHFVAVPQLDPADTLSAPAHAPQVLLGEPDAHSVAGEDQDVVLAVGRSHRDQLVVVGELDGHQGLIAGVVLLELGLLGLALLGHHHQVPAGLVIPGVDDGLDHLLRSEWKHRLGEDVRRGVAKDVKPLRLADRDHGEVARDLDGTIEIEEIAIQFDGDRSLGQARADGTRNLEPGHPVGVLDLGAVRIPEYYSQFSTR